MCPQGLGVTAGLWKAGLDRVSNVRHVSLGSGHEPGRTSACLRHTHKQGTASHFTPQEVQHHWQPRTHLDGVPSGLDPGVQRALQIQL